MKSRGALVGMVIGLLGAPIYGALIGGLYGVPWPTEPGPWITGPLGMQFGMVMYGLLLCIPMALVGAIVGGITKWQIRSLVAGGLLLGPGLGLVLLTLRHFWDDETRSRREALLPPPGSFGTWGPPAPSSSTRSTIAAFDKLGAEYGMMVLQPDGGYAFKTVQEAPAWGPAFRFKECDDFLLGKLPPVDVPFALELRDTKVTDEGLKHLAELKHLQWLNIGGTKVSADGVNNLKQALPDLKIVR